MNIPFKIESLSQLSKFVNENIEGSKVPDSLEMTLEQYSDFRTLQRLLDDSQKGWDIFNGIPVIII